MNVSVIYILSSQFSFPLHLVFFVPATFLMFLLQIACLFVAYPVGKEECEIIKEGKHI